MDSKTRFLQVLKSELAPLLRQEGFKGSGQSFYRVSNDLIHMLNIQGSKWGDGYAVNLGIHPLGMAIEGTSTAADPKNLKEYECLIRRRLSKPSESDHWWKHKGLFRNPERAARSLSRCYFQYGDQFFAAFGSGLVLLEAFDGKIIGRQSTVVIAGQQMARGRAALVGAWLAEHLQDHSRARELATLAESFRWQNWPFDDEIARLQQLTQSGPREYLVPESHTTLRKAP